ncbi:hypothetical protein Pint_35816 [Pistacia integerrima]|uniref:Uncharacterized protein n=1 Tax=Pistacia integerrima TaxID=434235 RepID=A0ACC0Y1Q4_9ROSI|nr:hypothetical protein Pint_35816 [Pistacia integerrima]
MATTTTIVQPQTPFLHLFSSAPPPKPKPHFLPFSTAASEPLLSSHHQPLLSSYPLNTHSSSLLNYTTTNIDLDVESFFTLLRLSVQYDDVPLAKAVHAAIVKLQEEEYTRLGHLLYRQGDDALNVWSRMENASIKPDAVTFVLIISAYRYSNSNLVDSCRKLFLSMKTIYNIEPSSEHYASLVGVLGYWGFLEEAEEMVNKMPFEPKISVWRALLDSCRARKNTTMGKRVAKHILTMDPQDASTYVLISNLYSASGRWRNSEMVREDMREKGFQKHPSKSWIIHQNKVHSFYTRDKSHPQEKEIYSGLEILILECLKAGYLPDTSYVLHEVEEYQKKDFLFYHSAKLAATFGLLTTQPGKPIRILKNILVCGDCHTFLKYVSDVARREIVLRDASGFHHFSDGQCSCKDFW